VCRDDSEVVENMKNVKNSVEKNSKIIEGRLKSQSSHKRFLKVILVFFTSKLALLDFLHID